jgi:hypothetical protein
MICSMNGSKSDSRTPRFAQDALDGGSDLANLVAMGLCPVYLQVLLDGLHHIVHEVAKERLLIHPLGVVGDRIVEP